MASQQDHDPAGFAVVRHGFDRTQVKQYLSDLEAEGKRHAAERDDALTKAKELAGQLELLRRENTALTERLDSIGTGPDASPSERASRALHLAKTQAAETTARAQTAADTAWAAAEDASTALRERYRKLLADLDRQHAEIHAEHKSIMDVAHAKVTEMTTLADQRRQDLDAAAEQQRQAIEDNFASEMAEKRAALQKEIEAALAAADVEAKRRIDEATEEAANRIATATAHVDRLTALRWELAGRLRDTSDLLTQSSTLLQPLESETELMEEGSPQPSR